MVGKLRFLKVFPIILQKLFLLRVDFFMAVIDFLWRKIYQFHSFLFSFLLLQHAEIKPIN